MHSKPPAKMDVEGSNPTAVAVTNEAKPALEQAPQPELRLESKKDSKTEDKRIDRRRTKRSSSNKSKSRERRHRRRHSRSEDRNRRSKRDRHSSKMIMFTLNNSK